LGDDHVAERHPIDAAGRGRPAALDIKVDGVSGRREGSGQTGEPISAIVVSAAATPTTDEAFRIVASENKNG